MIVRNTPVPTADASRKTSPAASAQANDHFASELQKQMSGHKPQTQQAQESSKALQESKKRPAEDKTPPEGAEVTLSQTPAPTDPLALLVDSSLLGAPATVETALPQDGQAQQPASPALLISTMEALMPAVAPVAVTTQPQPATTQSDVAQALAVANNASQALPVQSANLLPAAPDATVLPTAQDIDVSPVALQPQASAVHGERSASPTKRETTPVSQSGAQVQTSPETLKETSAKPASFAENMASALQNINQSEPQPAPHQTLTHSTPVVPASIATSTPVTPTVPAPGVATGTLQAEVGTPAWQQSLGQQIAVFSRNGIHHAELRLHPEDLGALQVSLKVNNDQAQVHFVAESHQVRAALESAMPHLRTMLAESGIQLGQSSVGADTASSSGSAFSGEFSGQGNQGQESTEPGVLAEEERILQPVVIKYSSGINTFV